MIVINNVATENIMHSSLNEFQNAAHVSSEFIGSAVITRKHLRGLISASPNSNWCAEIIDVTFTKMAFNAPKK